jgi:hypothetical protein
VTWPKSDPSAKRAHRFTCRSWRHEGACRDWKGAQDFVRVRDAIASRSGWVYIVLTFNPQQWGDEWEAYRAGVKLWGRLRRRMERTWGKIEHIQTWERHQSGWPHVNILIHNEHLAADCAGDGWKKVRKEWLEPNAIACGWGMRTWIEPMKDQEAMAGYMTKLARELVGAGVKDQVPINAPKHFRRLRASPGLLPPPHKNPEYTGELRQVPVELVESRLERDRDELSLRSAGQEGALHHGAGVRRRQPHHDYDRLAVDSRRDARRSHRGRRRVASYAPRRRCEVVGAQVQGVAATIVTLLQQRGP